MSFLSDISFRRGIGLLVVVLAILIGGTWTTIKLTTDHLVNEYVQGAASDWAHFLANNVTDLDKIASGEQPSAASMAFFLATQKSDQVFRYVIFNREGYSQLVVGPKKDRAGRYVAVQPRGRPRHCPRSARGRRQARHVAGRSEELR